MWVTEFSGVTPDRKIVEYQTRARVGHSQAERADRVRVGGKVVHTGWVSDHQGYNVYRRVRDGEA